MGKNKDFYLDPTNHKSDSAVVVKGANGETVIDRSSKNRHIMYYTIDENASVSKEDIIISVNTLDDSDIHRLDAFYLHDPSQRKTWLCIGRVANRYNLGLSEEDDDLDPEILEAERYWYYRFIELENYENVMTSVNINLGNNLLEITSFGDNTPNHVRIGNESRGFMLEKQ